MGLDPAMPTATTRPDLVVRNQDTASGTIESDARGVQRSVTRDEEGAATATYRSRRPRPHGTSSPDRRHDDQRLDEVWVGRVDIVESKP